MADARFGERDDESEDMADLGSSSASSSYAIVRRGDDDFGGGAAAKLAQPLHKRVLKLCLKNVLKFCCRAQPNQFRSLLCTEGSLQLSIFTLISQ